MIAKTDLENSYVDRLRNPWLETAGSSAILVEIGLASLAAATGERFFAELARFLGREVGWKCVVIGHLDSTAQRVSPIRCWSNGRFLPTSEFDLADTPCAGSSVEEIRIVPQGVRDRHPENRFLARHNAEAYVGQIIANSDGAPVAFIELIHGELHPRIDSTAQLLRLLSARVSTEIEHRFQRMQRCEEDARHRFVCDQVSDVIHTHDVEGRILTISPSIRRLLGYEPPELIGRHPFDMIHPDDLHLVLSAYRATVEKPGARAVCYRVKMKSGSWRWLETALHAFRDSRTSIPIEVLAVSHDITLQMPAEQESRKAATRKLLHVQQTPLGVIEFSPAGEVVEWNPAAERIFGWKREDIQGRHYSVLVPADQQAEVAEIWRSLLNQKGGFRKKNGNVRADGRRIHCEWYNTPLIDADGTTVGVASLVQDISEIRRAEELIENQKMQMIAASKMSSLGEMAAGIAHEINNPLAIIFGRVEQLRKAVDRPNPRTDRIAELATNIGATADRIARIVSGLLFFARDGARDNFERKPLDRLIDDTLAFCQSRFQNHSIRLEIEPPSKKVVLECRPIQISQVLLNLLNNAFDAIQPLNDRWIRISWREVGEDVEIRVADSGTGIPEQIADRIMTPFYTTKEIGKGTGLGLSISRGIVEAHRGQLELDRTASHTTFVIRLPKRRSLRGRNKQALAQLVH